MKSKFWFIVTVILLVFFASAAADWLAHPSPVHAESLSAAAPVDPNPDSAAVEAAQTLGGASPVVQVAVGLVVGLFGLLALMPVLQEEG